jgi:hypothetical protein
MPTDQIPPNEEGTSLVDISLFAVIFFGLYGAFISNLIAAPKIHYVPLFAAILLAIFRSLKRYNTTKYLAATALAALSPVFASEANAYLSYFSSIVLPIFWFGVGRYIHPEKIASWLLVLSGFLIVGIIIEVLDVFPGLFPYIGVKLGEELGRRYGSFALNPLALGYYASISGALFLLIRSRALKYIGIASSILLLGFANSRGGMATFLLALIIFWSLNKRNPPRLSRFSKELRYSVYALVVGVSIAFALSTPRLSSMFDWTGDEGNLGRLNQWGYCLAYIVNNPFHGLGAGAMSPIGLGDDPYIEEGIVKSCDSTWLKIGVEYNLASALTYFTIIIILIGQVIPRRRHTTNQSIRHLLDKKYFASVSIVCAVFFQQLMNQTLESVWIGALFFSLLGYCHTKIKPEGSSKNSIIIKNNYL